MRFQMLASQPMRGALLILPMHFVRAEQQPPASFYDVLPLIEEGGMALIQAPAALLDLNALAGEEIDRDSMEDGMERAWEQLSSDVQPGCAVIDTHTGAMFVFNSFGQPRRVGNLLDCVHDDPHQSFHGAANLPISYRGSVVVDLRSRTPFIIHQLLATLMPELAPDTIKGAVLGMDSIVLDIPTLCRLTLMVIQHVGAQHAQIQQTPLRHKPLQPVRDLLKVRLVG